MNKTYFLAFKYSYLHQLNNPLELLSRIILYTLISVLLGQITKATGFNDERVVYIFITQLIMLSPFLLTFQIEEEVKSGKIDILLSKPFNYIWFNYFYALGPTCLRYFILYLILLFQIYFFTNFLINYWHLLLTILLGFISVSISILISIFIGVMSFWFGDIKQIFYFNQTATLFFGGHITPIILYPTVIGTLSFLTPYPFVLYSTAIVTVGSGEKYGIIFSIFWIILILAGITKIINYKLNNN
jgi:ABC-2 type transport system permease protein